MQDDWMQDDDKKKSNDRQKNSLMLGDIQIATKAKLPQGRPARSRRGIP
jgi:hypothetical protein